MPDKRLEDLDIGGWVAHPLGDRMHETHTDLTVVAGVALADVVEQATQDKQVGTLDPIDEPSGFGRRLQQVTIDGEPVVGVALRAMPIRGPLRNQSGDEIDLVKCFDHPDHVVPHQQQVDEKLAGFIGPRIREGGAFGRNAIQNIADDEGVFAGGMNRHSQRHDRIADRGIVGKREGFLGEEDAVPEIAGARQPATATTSLVDPMQDGILDPGDGARCFGDRRHQEVGVAVTEGVRDLVLLLQQQLVVGATGGAVQFDARRQQHTLRPVECFPLGVLEQARVGEIDPLEAVKISQAALRELEVWFEQEGELTRLLMTSRMRTSSWSSIRSAFSRH